MYYGADYYPEHWPHERWECDAELMAQGRHQPGPRGRVRLGPDGARAGPL
ncbi:MAG: hypothetical protein ACOX2R_12440 [Anaerolineae bacterium]